MNFTNDEKSLAEALGWIVGLFEQYHIPYQVIGGCAARAYGAKRPIADIDLYAPLAGTDALLMEFKPYLIRALLPRKSAVWDIRYLAIEYKGVIIEIGDSSQDLRYFDAARKEWIAHNPDYGSSAKVLLFGVPVSVMPLAEVIQYKRALARPVDLADLSAIDPEWDGRPVPDLPSSVTMELELRDFDVARFEPLVSQFEAEGITFTSLAELGCTEEARRALYTVNDATSQPAPGSGKKSGWESFAAFDEEICKAEWFDPAGQIVAMLPDGSFAAMSAITRFAGSGNTWNLHTGALPLWKDRGL